MLHSCGEFLRHSGVCIFFTASTHHYEVLGNTLKSADDLSACPKGSTIHGGRVGQMRVRHVFRDIPK